MRLIKLPKGFGSVPIAIRNAFSIALAGVVVGGLFTLNAFAEVVTMTADKDATIYSNSSFSNGSGDFLHLGLNNSESLTKRVVLHFDVEGILPMWATLDSVKLTMYVSRTQIGNKTVDLFTLSEHWSEGPSDAGGNEGSGTASLPGDVTWLHTSYNTEFWSTPGGTYVQPAVASMVVGDTGHYTWGSTTAMVDDVQRWIDHPDSNFGWLMINDEASRSSKRFDSRHNQNVSQRPQLSVWYTPVENCHCPLQGDMNGDGFFNALDLNLMIDALYFEGDLPQDSQCPTARADATSDGDLDMMDIEFMVGVLFFGGPFPINPCGL
jgi:hypothetical protein